MCFSVPRQKSEPCVVILNNTGLQDAAQKGLLQISDAVMPPRKSQPDEDPSSQKDEENEAEPWMNMPLYSKEERGNYTILGEYISAKGPRPEFNKSITYTTQATHDFFIPHISELCERWGGPVSLSVYAPGSDLDEVHRKLAHALKCGHPCVSQNVSVHIVYHNDHVPANVSTDPDKLIDKIPVDCTVSPKVGENYRVKAKLTYPINVLRNSARLRASTRYILASDIELYPSINIIPRFVAMVEADKLLTTVPHVYTLPIFEVERGQKVPRTKNELIMLYNEKKSIFFHRLVCDQCQNFPSRNKWIATAETGADKLATFTTTKRRRDKSSWEPIYIGTNEEPLYEEVLTWEGKRDKMSQMFELCLIDYDFRVLDDAFLCHAPGIKRITKTELNWRAPFVKSNNKEYPAILARIKNGHPEVRPYKCI